MIVPSVNVETCLSSTVRCMRQLVNVNAVTPQECVMEVSVDRNLGMAVPTLKKTVNVDVD